MKLTFGFLATIRSLAERHNVPISEIADKLEDMENITESTRRITMSNLYFIANTLQIQPHTLLEIFERELSGKAPDYEDSLAWARVCVQDVEDKQEEVERLKREMRKADQELQEARRNSESAHAELRVAFAQKHANILPGVFAQGLHYDLPKSHWIRPAHDWAAVGGVR